MTLSKEAYKALEETVGSENISDDPALCDSYAFQWLAETVRPEQSHFMPRPVAALMPGTAEEVQSIVKVCNQYKIKVKPYSTGWYHFAAPQKDGDDTVQLDLRRMNRIIEIDTRNMIAVVEPYVICATLQAEAWKVGLNCNIIGAGASTSALASATSYGGAGPTSIYMGGNTDNLLGLEWVMPNGEILRTGSLGYGSGWFSGEGPGPSLRGLCRGARGARGGMGVYTKVALKLTHWPGPPCLPIEGTIPAYHSPLPDNFRAYTIAFPSWEAYGDACHKMWDNELGYVWHRQFSKLGTDIGPAFWLLYNDPTKTLSDIDEVAKKPEVQELIKEMKIAFQLSLAGNSVEDIEYQDRVLDLILADTGGWKVARMSEKDMTEFTHLYLNRMGHKSLNFVYTGGYLGGYSTGGPPEYVNQYQKVAIAQLTRDQQSGKVVQCGGDSLMGSGARYGGGGDYGAEQFCFYDPADKESVKAGIDHMKDASKEAIKNGFPTGKEAAYLQVGFTDEELIQTFSKGGQPLVHHLQRKIKQMIDPNDLGDRLYITLPEPEK